MNFPAGQLDDADANSEVPLEVVIVTYRSSALIHACLRSVVDHTPSGTRVHVVDNASPDDTVDVVRSTFPDVDLIARDDNPGFAVANNMALRQVTAEYVLVLNPDAELASGVVQHLISELERDRTIGAIGCRLLTADGTIDHASKRFVPSPKDAAQYFAGRVVGKRVSRYVAPHVGEFDVADVDAINGAFMLMRKDALDEIGLFDEAYWMYGEDLDLCARLKLRGWRVVYDGRVTAYHLKGGSAGTRSLRLNYEFHKSMARYFGTYNKGGPLSNVAVRSAIWAKFVLTALSDGIRRQAQRLAR